jgi:hypothetical protein
MEQPGVQQLFFQHIKNNLPQHISFVDEMADLLNISNDSAYRRIRGEKPISFEEIRTLCSHFKISLDQLFHLNSEAIIFTGRYVNEKNFSFDLWLENILQQLEFMNSHDRKELLYLTKDIPIFHLFNYQELAAFKFSFWMRTILQYPGTGKGLYLADEFIDSLQKTGQKIVEVYNKVPSREVWNLESINSTIRQIEYYKDTKVFETGRDILKLYECLEKTIDHIEAQAEAGYKFDLSGHPLTRRVHFKLYINEFILGDNSNLAILNDTKVAYLNHSVLNIVWTKDPSFVDYTYKHIQNIISKSTLISDVGEKERTRFFNAIRDKIDHRKKAVAHYSLP